MHKCNVKSLRRQESTMNKLTIWIQYIWKFSEERKLHRPTTTSDSQTSNQRMSSYSPSICTTMSHGPTICIQFYAAILQWMNFIVNFHSSEVNLAHVAYHDDLSSCKMDKNKTKQKKNEFHFADGRRVIEHAKKRAHASISPGVKLVNMLAFLQNEFIKVENEMNEKWNFSHRMKYIIRAWVSSVFDNQQNGREWKRFLFSFVIRRIDDIAIGIRSGMNEINQSNILECVIVREREQRKTE